MRRPWRRERAPRGFHRESRKESFAVFPFNMNEDVLIPLAIFAIPIVAITGGIVMGIVRSLGRQRMM